MIAVHSSACKKCSQINCHIVFLRPIVSLQFDLKYIVRV